MPTCCCSSVAARLFDSISAARSVSASGGVVADVARRPLVGALRRQPIEPAQLDTGDKPRSRAAAKTNGLKAEPGCRRLRLARLNADALIVAAADQRQHVAGARIDGDQRRLQAALIRGGRARASPRVSAASCSGATKVVSTRQSGGWSPPNSSRNRCRR